MRNERWRQWAAERGYRIAFGPLALVGAAQEALEAARRDGRIGPQFFSEWLGGFRYLRDWSPAGGALVMLAAPRPATLVRMDWDGAAREFLIPPTYVNYRATFERIRSDAAATVARHEYRVERLDAPLKLLAAWTGLARYGRNNIAYVDGLGSYVQLIGLLTDMPLDVPETRLAPGDGLALAARCARCHACERACPTGAIGADRTQLHVERCYTRFSETRADLPPGMAPPSPECLIGCLGCQTVCPLNRGRLRFDERPVVLDRAESAAFRAGPDGDPAGWPAVRDRFAALGLTEDAAILSRNLVRVPTMKTGPHRPRGRQAERAARVPGSDRLD